MKRLLGILFLAVAAAWGGEPFGPGERVAFIGDSITHGGEYHTLVQAFYATRFPERRVACLNVGISGDTARGGWERSAQHGKGVWETDLDQYRATSAVVMLGMNDVGGWHFLHVASREEMDAQNAQLLASYRHNYTNLLDRLEARGLARIILVKSSPYDQTMVDPKAADNLFRFGVGKNDALDAIAEKVVLVEGRRRGYPVCDFSAPMLAINAAEQAADSSFSIIGRDRVHPGHDGHMVMAYAFLKFQGLSGPVASVGISPGTDGPAKMELANCTVSNLDLAGMGASFEYLSKSLPFPRGEYSGVAALVPFESEFNQELLRVEGLGPGRYGLRIDGRELATYGHEELAQGINLVLLDDAPQMVQARKVMDMCRERAQLAKSIRDVVWSVGYLRKVKGYEGFNDLDSNREMIGRILAGETFDGLWETTEYVKGNLRSYSEHAPRYEALLAELESMTRAVYEASQPRTLHIEVVRQDE